MFIGIRNTVRFFILCASYITIIVNSVSTTHMRGFSNKIYVQENYCSTHDLYLFFFETHYTNLEEEKKNIRFLGVYNFELKHIKEVLLTVQLSFESYTQRYSAMVCCIMLRH